MAVDIFDYDLQGTPRVACDEGNDDEDASFDPGSVSSGNIIPLPRTLARFSNQNVTSRGEENFSHSTLLHLVH